MAIALFTLAALAGIAYTSPVLHRRATSNDTTVFTNYNGLNFTQMNTTLPNVTIFATGEKTLDW